MATTQAASDEVLEENIPTPAPAVAEGESVPAAEDEPVRTVEVTATDGAAVTINEPSEEAGAKDDCQMDIEIQGGTTTVSVSWTEKNEEGPVAEEKSSAGDQMSTDDMNGNQPQRDVGDAMDSTQEAPEIGGKRKAESTDESSPKKKPKLINDGFCVVVSNLDNTKSLDKLKDSIANYFMSQSLLVQDIRVHPYKYYAFVDLASQLDLTKALALKRQVLLNKPIKIKKARVVEVCEEEEEEKKKKKVKVPLSPLEKKQAKDARSVYVQNLPYNMTKEELLKLFPKAVTARFLGGFEAPNKGAAFLEYPRPTMAAKVRESTDGITVGGRVLQVRMVGEKVEPKAKPPPPPSNTLYVGNLHYKAHEKTIKKVFKEAITIGLPHKDGKLKGYAFVEFASVEQAEKALKASRNTSILKRPIQVMFGEAKQQVKASTELSSKTLMVRSLAAKTTPDTLQRAFEGAVSARVITDKATRVSKGYGFVDFDTDEACKAAKESIVDCEIDGSKVTTEYARVAPPRVRPAPAQVAEAPEVPPEVPEGVTAQPGGDVEEQTVVAEKKKKKKKKKRKGKGKGAGKPQEEVKEVENKAVEIQS